jgi:hypothetical protein
LVSGTALAVDIGFVAVVSAVVVVDGDAEGVADGPGAAFEEIEKEEGDEGNCRACRRFRCRLASLYICASTLASRCGRRYIWPRAASGSDSESAKEFTARAEMRAAMADWRYMASG